MTLNDKTLNKWVESSFTPINTVQRQAIIERFGTEPEPYVWTEQDIWVQIRNYLVCGEFVKNTPIDTQSSSNI